MKHDGSRHKTILLCREDWELIFRIFAYVEKFVIHFDLSLLGTNHSSFVLIIVLVYTMMLCIVAIIFCSQFFDVYSDMRSLTLRIFHCWRIASFHHRCGHYYTVGHAVSIVTCMIIYA